MDCFSNSNDVELEGTCTYALSHIYTTKSQSNYRQRKKVLLRHGVPQGGVLPPTLFLIFINDLIKQLPDAVKCVMYADDLVLWCKEEGVVTRSLHFM